ASGVSVSANGQAESHSMSGSLENERVSASDGTDCDSNNNDNKDSNSNSNNVKSLEELLTDEPISVDRLVEVTGLSVGEVNYMLLLLELDGKAESLPGSRYLRGGSRRQQLMPGVRRCITIEPAHEWIVDAVNEFIVGVFKGVSRKCLQYYVAA